ncbi:hypothetical protein [Rhizobium sp. 007]|uniref:hypothetical protein n=1 Tax=Rhizobium sp. 007 TaxID=2785056 RepID=UPI00188F545C|nr:hypothetical protein [Rhizobium sp. 007]QPB22382.1 hypothetical protein ISN39_22400 [Rhizobium sp. 007]
MTTSITALLQTPPLLRDLSLDGAAGAMNLLSWGRVLRDNANPAMPLRSAKSHYSFTVV